MLYLSAPYTEVPSTPVLGVLSRRSHRRCARIRCAPPVARNATHSSHGAQEAHLHAEHDAPDHGHGRDQAVPGPADSLEGRQALAVKRWTSRLPGKHFPTSPARSRTRCTRARPSSFFLGGRASLTYHRGRAAGPRRQFAIVQGVPAKKKTSTATRKSEKTTKRNRARTALGQQEGAKPTSLDQFRPLLNTNQISPVYDKLGLKDRKSVV